MGMAGRKLPRDTSPVPVFAVGDRVRVKDGSLGTVVSYEPTTLTVGAWVHVRQDVAQLGVGTVGLFGARSLTKV